MVKSNRKNGRTMSMPAGLATGGVISLLITIGGAAALAVLIDREKMTWNNIGYGLVVVLFVASFAGALISAGKIRRRIFLVCTAAGIVYMGILAMITVLFFGGRFEAVGVTTGVVMAGTVSALLLHITKNDGKKGKRIGKYR